LLGVMVSEAVGYEKLSQPSVNPSALHYILKSEYARSSTVKSYPAGICKKLIKSTVLSLRLKVDSWSTV